MLSGKLPALGFTLFAKAPPLVSGPTSAPLYYLGVLQTSFVPSWSFKDTSVNFVTFWTMWIATVWILVGYSSLKEKLVLLGDVLFCTLSHFLKHRRNH